MKSIEDFVQFEYLMIFLMGLNEKFSHSRSQILLMDPSPIVSKALALITQEEEQRQDIVINTSSTVALAVNSTNASGRSSGNNQSNNRKQGNRPFCTNCGIQWHTIDKCYKLHGYPPGYRQKYNQRPSNNVPTNQQNTKLNSNDNVVASGNQGNVETQQPARKILLLNVRIS
ncbi:MAG: hypothetical protein Q8835_02700 [Sweet potato little leaf phytoplasma]|nr:hypothetical protein [Sweet potato little leaf phytoplasma]